MGDQQVVKEVNELHFAKYCEATSKGYLKFYSDIISGKIRHSADESAMKR